MHFRISRTMNAEDIFRCSIGCEIMLMIKARIRLIFSRFNPIIASKASGRDCTNNNELLHKIGVLQRYAMQLFVFTIDSMTQ